MQLLKKIIDKIAAVFNTIAGVFLMIMMVLSFADVAMRTFFNQPIQGTYEISGLFCVIIIGLALGSTQLAKSHIRVDIFLLFMSEKRRNLVEFIINILCFIMSLLIAWQSWLYAVSLAAVGEASQTQKIPLAPFEFVVSIGFFFLCLVLLYEMIQQVRGRKC